METPKKKGTRPSKSLADTVHKAELMLKGLQANATEVAKRGLTAEFLSTMQEAIQEMKKRNAEQEKTKALLKMQTEAFNEKMEEVTKMLSESKKVVKLSLPQAQWIEFGMTDKR
ncbi:hypothetical protein [Bergeyella zoohelcum]|uniref:Uncharacterized protein n=1 Tax=Bergeyella zoohelcum TaxID=1015 RepID=A0A7Z8YNX3_9FLAO|nr:hypothetical protein [Bergeyella zoohelcum]VDH03432.1 Uncharacterised protein [Bergeyella zoohelcum]